MVPIADLTPLFGPVPGGAEIIVIFLIALVLFGLPIVLLGGGLVLYRRNKSERPAGEEFEALRTEVQQLREEVRRMNDEESGDEK